MKTTRRGLLHGMAGLGALTVLPGLRIDRAILDEETGLKRHDPVATGWTISSRQEGSQTFYIVQNNNTFPILISWGSVIHMGAAPGRSVTLTSYDMNRIKRFDNPIRRADR